MTGEVTPANNRTSGVLAALRVYCLLLLGLTLLTPLLTEETAWGLWPVTYLSPVWRWILVGLGALVCIRPVTVRLVHYVSRITHHVSRFTSRLPRRTLFALLSLLSIISFLLFRIVHTRWGDAYILVNGLAWPDPALRLTATWQAPLTVWLHARLWALGNALFGWPDAWPVYRIVSPLAGALYIYLLLRLADSIGKNRTEKFLIVGLMGTLGMVQLFFAYAENYTLAAVGILLFLWLALETLRGRRALWQPALALAVTNGLHPSTVVLDPALLFVLWVWAKQGERGKARKAGKRGEAGRPAERVWLSGLAQVFVPMAAVALGVVVLMELSGHGLATLATTDRPGGGDARWFVPLTAVSTRWERYTMFSWPHLRDWLNEQMLTAPVTLGGLAIAGAAVTVDWRRTRGKGAMAGGATATESERLEGNSRSATETHTEASTEGDELVFLAICTGLYWLFTFVWNPDYGGQRDWDLFSLAALPSTLLLARLLPRVLPNRGDLAQAALMLTAVSALHTSAWIYQNTLPWEWPTK
ncbi:MAG: hypothetical protein R2844_20650 [Caldilineales bacterium]